MFTGKHGKDMMKIFYKMTKTITFNIYQLQNIYNKENKSYQYHTQYHNLV